MLTPATDLTTIDRIAREVPGARDVAAVVDLRLKATGPDAPEPDVSPRQGTPIPGDRPALVRGPDPVLPPDAVRTLPEALQLAARRAPDRGTTYVQADGSVDRQTYAQLLDDALRLLGGLREEGVQPGDAVLVHHADNRAFVTTWWACALGGFLPTALAAARDYSETNAAVRKLRAAWELLGHPLIVTDDNLRDRVGGLATTWDVGPALRVVSPGVLNIGEPAQPYDASPDDPALNLLTSGSTGTPKCVHHTHRSLIARTYATIEANGFTADDISLNWMPLDHVGGMVMFNLRDVVLRCEHVNAPTEMVVRRPVTWMDLVDRFRVTNTWAPNFAFSMVVKSAEEIQSAHWDLSSLNNICNAGEAVVPSTALRFVELLTPHGLPPDAMVPCWGMSETSSGVTYSRMDVRDPGVGTIALDPSSLEGQLVEFPPGTPRAVTICEVGAPIPGVELRIVDDSGSLLPEGRVGRLHVSGTTILQQYLHNEAANAASFTEDGWFDTGDLGFLRDGKLFLSGRKKHMVIVNGVNYPAHEVEAVIERVPGVRPACTVVCAVRDEADDTDSIVVFFVPADDAVGELQRLLSEISGVLAADLGLRAKWLVPVSEADFPRAPGGKVQRERLIEGFREGRFSETYPGDAAPSTEEEDDALLVPAWVSVDRAEPAASASCTVVYAPPGWTPAADDVIDAIITSAAQFRVVDSHHVEADLTDPAQQLQAMAHLRESVAHPDRVIYAVEAGEPAAADDECGPAARFVCTVAAVSSRLPEVDVTVLTTGALGVQAHDAVVPPRAALPALVRTAAAERLFRSIRMLDAPDADALAHQPGAIPAFDADIVGLRDGAGYVQRLRRVERTDRFDMPDRFLPPDGAVLITGGLGGLGRAVAEHLLVAAGARLLIVGRTPEDQLAGTGRDRVLADLRGLGDVRYAAVDVADAEALSAAVAEAEQEWGAGLDLVLHAAGAPVAPQWQQLSAHELRHETLPWLRQMLRPKLGGALAIDRLLQTRPGTSVVLFSSVNGFLGGASFGAYSAANATLDGFAHQWAARGHAVRSISWSMWDGAGMNDGSPLVAPARHRGLRLISPGEGLSLLLACLHNSAPTVLAGADAANPHVKAYLAPDQFEGGGVVVAVVPEADAEPDDVGRAVGAELAAHGVFARVVIVRALPVDSAGAVDPVAVLAAGDVRAGRHREPVGPAEMLVAEVTRDLLGVAQVGRDDSFFGLGCDSVRAMQLAERIGAALGRDLPVSSLYEHPTVRELAATVEIADTEAALAG
jgi:acyl-CoA synthetase (AMP-forming)/AMP-acid ligase II/NAD(P)-dependent dehydrogenase (short-subunit alcohol dehydrogenase family)/aryl carrier-like protein